MIIQPMFLSTQLMADRLMAGSLCQHTHWVINLIGWVDATVWESLVVTCCNHSHGAFGCYGVTIVSGCKWWVVIHKPHGYESQRKHGTWSSHDRAPGTRGPTCPRSRHFGRRTSHGWAASESAKTQTIFTAYCLTQPFAQRSWWGSWTSLRQQKCHSTSVETMVNIALNYGLSAINQRDMQQPLCTNQRSRTITKDWN